MEENRTLLTELANIARLMLACIILIFLCSLIYTTSTLLIARADGVYPSAEDGMLAMIQQNYINPEQVEVIYGGPSAYEFGRPHVRYVIACIWGGTHKDGTPVGSEVNVYDQPGNFFLDTRAGWVFVPEGFMPGLLGFWMKVYGLAGPGISIPTYDWQSSPGQCFVR
jgi:hypothetical protein